jgi:transposase
MLIEYNNKKRKPGRDIRLKSTGQIFVRRFLSLTPGETISKKEMNEIAPYWDRFPDLPAKQNAIAFAGKMVNRGTKKHGVVILYNPDSYTRMRDDEITYTKTYTTPIVSKVPEVVRLNWDIRDAAYNATLEYCLKHLEYTDSNYARLCTKYSERTDKYVKEQDWYKKYKGQYASHAVINGREDCILALKRWIKDYKPSDPKKGKPKERSSKHGSTFTFQDNNVRWEGNELRVNNVNKKKSTPPMITARECYIPPGGQSVEVTLSFKDKKMWACIVYKYVKKRPDPKKKYVIGLDLGVKKNIQCSNGKVFHPPDIVFKLRRQIDDLKRAQTHRVGPWGIKALPNKRERKKGEKVSLAWDRGNKQLKRLQTRLHNILKEYRHHATTTLVKKNAEIVVDPFDNSPKKATVDEHGREIKGKGKKKINRATQLAAPKTVLNMLQYKAHSMGHVLKVVETGTVTTNRCSKCDYILPRDQRLSLHDKSRIFRCPSCDHTQDRDLNAAIVTEGMGTKGMKRASEKVS